MNVPVSVMESAGEGGAWGIAVLAAYMLYKTSSTSDESFDKYLTDKVFAGQHEVTVTPTQADIEGFAVFMERYKQGLVIESTAVNAFMLGAANGNR
jgi:sugar (pentulose or hexulose) kinase